MTPLQQSNSPEPLRSAPLALADGLAGRVADTPDSGVSAAQAEADAALAARKKADEAA